MELAEAFKIFGMKQGEIIKVEGLKVKYRRLSKEAHPDLGGSDEKAAQVNLAYETIKNYLSGGAHTFREIPKRTGVKEVSMYEYYGDLYELNMNRYRDSRIVLNFDIEIELSNGERAKENISMPLEKSHKYRVGANISEENPAGIAGARCRLLGQEIILDRCASSFGFICRYGRAELAVYVRRVRRK